MGIYSKGRLVIQNNNPKKKNKDVVFLVIEIIRNFV